MSSSGSIFRGLILLTLFFFTGLSPALTSEGDNAVSPDLLKSLSINRSMLARFESEYSALSKKAEESPSDQVKRDLDNVQYKIKALDEDGQEMTKILPETLQASEFLKDMLTRSETSKKTEAVKAHPTKYSGHPRVLPFPTDTVSLNATPLQEKTPDIAVAPVIPAAPVVPVNTKSSEETYRLHERALEYVTKKELKMAIKLYEEIVLIDPNDDEAYLIMGHCLVLTGEYEKAEEAFQNATHINPESVNQIVPFYENLVAQNPQDPDVYANLGFVCLMVGNLNHASEAFKEALKINPQHPNSLRGMRILENHPS